MHKYNLLPLFFLLLIFSHKLLSAEANQNTLLNDLLRALPEKALTLDLVAAGAMKSDSFKTTQAEAYKIPTAELKAEALHDTKVSISQNWFKDESDVANSFSPNFKKGNGSSISLSRYFSTGTAVEVSASQGYNDIRFLTTTIPPYHETQGIISLSQNLWADGFGYASRRGLKAAQFASQAQKFNHLSSVETWFMGITSQFYSTWLSQTQAQAAQENYKRRERLLKSAKIQLKRGTTETPDYLQIESAYLGAKIKMAETETAVEDQWRRLIILLKLPSDWMQINALKVPIQIDNIVDDAVLLCSQFRNKGVPQKEPAQLKQAQLSFESAKLNYDRAKNQSHPDLKISGSYSVNGIGDREGSTTEILDHDHPGWTVGLTLSMPLGFSQQKAEVAQATADRMTAEAYATTAKDERDLSWLKECSNLERLQNAVKDADLAFKYQKKRADLEERRFLIGRSNTFNVIQAGDDTANAEIALNATEVEVRQTAWRIMVLDSKVATKLNQFVKKHGGSFTLE